MHSRSFFLGVSSIFLLALAACSSSPSNPTGGGGSTGTTSTTGTTGGTGGGTGGAGGGTGGTGGGAPAPKCTMPTAVPCSDAVILQMNLKKDVTPGLITSQADGDGFTSNIDATAGGAFASEPNSYTYGKFTDAGLTKVDISDEDALDSMAWDIAFRRYVVRINSGNSGPSCVEAARLPGKPKYEDVTTVDAGLLFHKDDYFTQSCDLIPDGSGLMGSPATALSSYWTYPGCVQMTDHVFVIALADGRHVKFQVNDYYKPDVQEKCDTTGSIPMTGTGSANFIVRWAYLP
ncbi:MAG: HmuY family protein [Byssovorax sp.]